MGPAKPGNQRSIERYGAKSYRDFSLKNEVYSRKHTSSFQKRFFYYNFSASTSLFDKKTFSLTVINVKKLGTNRETKLTNKPAQFTDKVIACRETQQRNFHIRYKFYGY